MQTNGDLIGHRARRHEHGRFHPQHFGDSMLKTIDGGVDVDHIVSDFGVGHSPTHPRARNRHCVATQVDQFSGCHSFANESRAR